MVFTLVNAKMVKAMRSGAAALDVRCVDLWGGLLEEMEDHLDASRMCEPARSIWHLACMMRMQAFDTAVHSYLG